MKCTIELIAITLLSCFCFIQVFYYLFFFLRLAIFKNKPILNNPINYFSLVICAKNEDENIRKNIDLWMNQNYYNTDGEPMYEVVLIDDNSDEGSFYLYQEIEKKYPQLRIVKLRQEAKGIRGKKFPLSMGIKEAKYENLILTDADCTPSSNDWLLQIANSYKENTQIVLGYGAYNKYKGFLNKYIRWETAISAIQYLSYALAKMPYMGVGRNLSYKKSLFINNKGFSSHTHLLSGDDDLFINQVATNKNTKINIHPDAFTYSEPKTSYDSWVFQKKRHYSTSTYYKVFHKFLLGLFSMSHFLFWGIFIWCLCYPKYFIITMSIFFTRWIIQYIILAICLKKLKEYDLISTIWLFDIITLFYNLKMLPSIFIKNKQWK